MGSLSNLYISQSYQSLIHLGTDNTASANLIGLQDGLGNSIGVSVNTAGDLYLSGSISASLPQGYALVGNSSNRTIAVATSSFGAPLDSLNAYTQSNNQKWADLGNKSGSWITESETGSFARWDVSNPWSANQTFTNISAVSASFQYVETIFETASVIYSSGSNQLGDELTDVQTLSGSVLIRGGLIVNNLDVTASLNSLSSKTGSYATTGSNIFVGNQTLTNGANLNVSGNIALTGDNSRINFPNGTYMLGTPGDYFGVNSDGSSQQFTVGDSAPIPGAYNISFRNTTPNGQIIFANQNGGTISLSGSATEIQGVSFIPFSQSVDNRLDVLEVSSSLALYTASFNTGSRNLTFTKGDNTTFSVNIPDVSGSAGDFVTTSSFNAYTASNDDKVNQLIQATGSYAISSSVAVVDAAQQQQINALINATSSYAISASVAVVDAAQQAQINSLINATGSYVTETESGSFLITASFASQTLTFTKGDGTIFGVLIPDISGSTIDTGSFVTTSSFNAYTASNDQRVGSLESNSASVNISVSNINAFTQSADQRLDSIEAQSGSWVTSAITASSIITASVVDDDITFTKGDGTQFTIQVSTGSFAISASYAETASIARNLVVIARNGNPSTLPIGTVVHITSAVGDNPIFNTASFDTELLSANTLGVLRQAAISGTDVEVVVQGTVTGVNTDPTLGYAAGDVIYLSSSGQFTRVQPQAPNQIVVLGQVLRAQQNNGSIYVSINNGWELNELHNVQINNPQTGDLIQYESSSYGLWKNKSIAGAGITTTSSFNAYTSSTNNRLTNIEATTASLLIETQNLELFTASQALLNGTFATTGSNNFRGAQRIINPSNVGSENNGVILTAHSGSLILTNNAFTTGSYGYISASSAGQNNIIMQQNNAAADFILSGSFNIISMPAAPTAGFKRFIGIGNIALGGSNIPLLSGSMAFPITFNQNYFSGPATTITMRGPVSSSAWNISANNILGTINIGTTAANHAQSLAAGFTMTSNQINGTLNVIANQSYNYRSAAAVAGNFIGGSATLSMTGSALQFNNNIVNDTNTNIINGYYSGSVGTGTFLLNRNNLAGNNQTMFVSGAFPAGATFNAPIYNDNAMFGGDNTIFTNVSEAPITGSRALHSAIRIILAGHQLIVTGSSNTALADTYGSLFAGRWNVNDGVRNRSGQNVFAVGTGKNNTERKTGFLIDSGSNTFIEGTLNVSGSSQFSGSAQFTGSVSISNVLQLAQLDPLPAGATGQMAVSQSLLWFYDATQWRQVSLV